MTHIAVRGADENGSQSPPQSADERGADGPARMDAPFGRPPDARKPHISPELLLVGYLIFLFRLLVRAVGRTFGVSGDSSTLLTLVILGSVARGVRRVFAAPRTQVRKARSSPNFAANTMIGAAAFKETVDGIAGRPTRDKDFAAALIVFAVLTHSFRPAVARLRKSVRAVTLRALRAWFAARGSIAEQVVTSSRRRPAATLDAESDQVRRSDR